jgi:CelD/BcsL family acetyltransferase involved in cellulose biosynthesis
MDLTLHTVFPDDISFEQEWDLLVENSHANGPFMRCAYQKLWWQHRGGGEWPHASLVLVTARRQGKLVACAPLFHTPDYQGKPRLMLVGSVEVSDYLDLVAMPEDLNEFVLELLSFLRAAGLPEWQGLDLFNILENSPSLPALSASAEQHGWRYAQTRAYHCPHILIPGDWEIYLAGIDKKQRHEIRRKMRRMEESETPHRWYIVTEAETLDNEIDGFFALMEQDEDKIRFLTAEMRAFFRDEFHWAFEAGILMMSFLEIDGQKAAGYTAFDYLNRLWVYNSGINRSFFDYSPGWVLLGNLLRWCNETKHEAFDFMRGDEDYKYRFGAVDRFVMRASVDK